MRIPVKRFAQRLSRAIFLRNATTLVTLGLLTSGLAATLIYLNQHTEQQRQFEHAALQRLDALDHAIGENEMSLELVANALTQLGPITPSHFQELVDPLLRDSSALEFIAWFPTSAELARPMAVQPPEAIDRALRIPDRLLNDTAMPRRSGMTWGEDSQALVLIVRPVTAAHGILIGAFDLRAITRARQGSSTIQLHVFDLAGAAMPIVGPHRGTASGAAADYRLSDLRRRRHVSRALPISDRQWLALATPPPPPYWEPGRAALLTALVGMLLTVGLTTWTRGAAARRTSRRAVGGESELFSLNSSSGARPLAPERLRHLIDDAPEIVTQISASGKVLYVSPATREILDIDPSALMGRSFFDLLHPDDALRARQAQLQALNRPGVYSGHYRLRCSGGRYRWLDCIVRVITDPNTGEATGFIGIGRDGVRRHQEVQRLRDQEALYRSVFDSSLQPTVVLTIEGTRVFRVNQAFCNMLGYSKPELRALRAQDVIHPADHTRSRRAVARAHMSQQQRVRYEARYLRKDGTTVWTVVDMGLVREINGSPHYLVCHIMDITAQRAGQRELPGFEHTRSPNTADA